MDNLSAGRRSHRRAFGRATMEPDPPNDQMASEPEDPDLTDIDPEDDNQERPLAAGDRPTIRNLLRLGNSDAQLGGLVTPTLNLVALASVCTAVVGRPFASAVLWLIVLIGFGAADLLSGEISSPDVLGNRTVSRLLLTSSILVVTQENGELGVAAWIALALIGAAVVLEPALRRLHSFTATYVVNLPGFSSDNGHAPIGLVHLGSVVVLALAGLSALTELPWVASAIVGAMVAGVLVIDSLVQLVRALRTDQQRDRLRRALDAYAPTFALAWRADVGTDYQISMWLPYLELLDRPFIVVVRTRENFREAARLTDRPVLLRRSVDDLDDVLTPTLKTFFYVNNAAVNSHMVRYPGLKHVMLNHGDSDKSPSFNPVSRMYDRNFVAGQAAIDRFTQNGVDVNPAQFAIVGRPQIEDVRRASRPLTSLSRPTVLYAPTWAGFTADAQYSSLPVGVELVEELIRRGCNVIFRPHPYSYRSSHFTAICRRICTMLGADATPGASHVFGSRAESGMSVVECFNASDALISDVSSVATDYLQSEKPMALTATRGSVEEFSREFPLAQAAYVLAASGPRITNLAVALDQLLGEDPLREQRCALRSYYLGEPGNGSYVDLFLTKARQFV